MTIAPAGFTDRLVDLGGGRPRLAARQAGPAVPADGSPAFLLVHGLASNARLWDGVSAALAAAGRTAIAVDLRGHGRSEVPDTGYDTATAAADVAALVGVLGLDRPIVAGQSWGGNVVLTLAAQHRGVAGAIACVDGGWISPRDHFADFEACWAALAPPQFDHLTFADLARGIRAAHPDWPDAAIEGTLANLVELPDGGVRARLARDHHRSIVRSLYEGDPRREYPRVDVPVLLAPATGPEPVPGEDARAAGTRASVLEALAALPDGRVAWYPGADHDLHAQHPARFAADLLELATSRRPATTQERTR